MKTGNKELVPFLQKFWWLAFLRGVIAIMLGVALIINLDKATRSMAQFMGLYWLTSGIGGIVWGFNGSRRPGLWLLIGVSEVSVGSILLFRGWLDPLLSWTTVTRLAATLAFGAGLFNLYAGIHTGRVYGRKWSWGSFFMGALQITLGLMFVRAPDEISQLILYLATLWAFIGGTGLITNGLRLRQQLRGRNS